MPITIRSSQERGFFDYDWLRTYLTFSFGEYYNSKYMNFRSLRSINENFVKPAVGFPIEAHKDIEIISIVLEGSLAHQDDIGNGSILRPGQIQLLSTGRGIQHAEINASDKELLHFYQIWVLPHTKGLAPLYQEAEFLDSAKSNQWCLIVSQEGREGSLKIHQNIDAYLSYLEPDKKLMRDIAINRYGWLQIIEGNIDLNGQRLVKGDGAAISQTEYIVISAFQPSKILFFDLN